MSPPVTLPPPAGVNEPPPVLGQTVLIRAVWVRLNRRRDAHLMVGPWTLCGLFLDGAAPRTSTLGLPCRSCRALIRLSPLD